ncbi:hypothetical protein Thermus77420_01370 [Thermus thalpophilus]
MPQDRVASPEVHGAAIAVLGFREGRQGPGARAFTRRKPKKRRRPKVRVPLAWGRPRGGKVG